MGFSSLTPIYNKLMNELDCCHQCLETCFGGSNNEKNVIQEVLNLALEHLSRPTLNQIDIKLLLKGVEDLRTNLSKSCFSIYLRVILQSLPDLKNSEQETDSLEEDFVYLNSAEFSTDYFKVVCNFQDQMLVPVEAPAEEFTYQHPLFPSNGIHEKEYRKLFKNFPGFIQFLDHDKICSIVDDIFIQKASSQLIPNFPVFIPSQTLLDIRRFSKVSVNQQIIYDRENNCFLDTAEAILAEIVIQLKSHLNERILLKILRLCTQATFARCFLIVAKAFNSEQLQVLVQNAKRTEIEIISPCTTNKEWILCFKTIFPILFIEQEERKYIVCQRTFKLDQNEKGMIKDFYSPICETYEQAQKFDVDISLKHIFDSEWKTITFKKKW